MLLCMALLAVAGAFHAHPAGPGEAPRLEVRPHHKLVAADPCLACLLTRAVVEPAGDAAPADTRLEAAGAAPLPACPCTSRTGPAPRAGRSPPRLPARAA